MAASDDTTKRVLDKFNELRSVGGHNSYDQVKPTATTLEQKIKASSTAREIARNAKNTTSKTKTKKTTSSTANQAKVKSELKKMHDDPGIDWSGGFFSDAGGVVSKGFKKGMGALARPLDIISRPSYAVNEGMRNLVQSVNEGEPIWSLGDDLFYGMGRGLAGKAKTGYGDVVEETTNFDPADGQPRAVQQVMPFGLDRFYGGRTMQQLEETNPEVAKWSKRGLGLVGDMGLDPTNYVGIGLATDAVKGAQKSRALIGDAARQAAKEGIEESFTKAVKNLDPDFSKDLTRFLDEAPEAVGPFGSKVAARVVPDLGQINPGFIRQTINDIVEETLNPIAGGGMAGKSVHASKVRPQIITQKFVETVRNKKLTAVETDFKRVQQHFNGARKLKPEQIAKLRAKSKYVDTFWESYSKRRLEAIERIKKGSDVISDADVEKIYKESFDDAIDILNGEVEQLYREMLPEVSQLSVKAPVIKLFNGKRIVLRSSGDDMIGKIARSVGNTSAANVLKSAFSMSEYMPGYSSLIAQKIKSSHVSQYDEFYARATEPARQVGKQERKALTAGLHGAAVPKNLEPELERLRSLYDEIINEEIQMGLRDGEKVAKNYGYLYLKGGRKSERDRFLKQRKLELSTYGEPRTTTLEDAKRLGLRPVEDAYEALLLRKQKSMRDLTKFWFLDDLTAHYGVAAKHLEGSGKRELGALNRDLVKIDSNKLSHGLRKALKDGESYYLPKSMHEVFEKYSKAATMATGDETAGNILRSLDYVTRQFKTMSTVYYPSYHIRNLMGDVFMGALDGVKPWHYKRLKDQEGKMLKVAGNSIPHAEVRKAFEETASAGGFFNVEVPGATINNNPLTRANQAIRDGSELRENWGRFAHFYHAIDEEYAAMLKRFPTKDPTNLVNNKAWDMAKDNAIYRVNAYKFDYSALTPFEQKVMRRAIPFYTYSRKAMPILAESLFTSPGILSQTNRMLENLNERDPLDTMMVPDWLRQLGFSQVSGGDEPYVLRNDFLPSNIFNQQFGVGFGEGGLEGLSRNLMSQVNPVAQLPVELMTQEQIFSGRKASTTDILLGKLRPVGFGSQFVDMTKGNKDFWESFSFITGIPITKITEDMQKASFKTYEDVAQGLIYKANPKLEEKGYKIGYLKRQADDEDPRNGTMEYRVLKMDSEGKYHAITTGISSIEEAMILARRAAGV